MPNAIPEQPASRAPQPPAVVAPASAPAPAALPEEGPVRAAPSPGPPHAPSAAAAAAVSTGRSCKTCPGVGGCRHYMCEEGRGCGDAEFKKKSAGGQNGLWRRCVTKPAPVHAPPLRASIISPCRPSMHAAMRTNLALCTMHAALVHTGSSPCPCIPLRLRHTCHTPARHEHTPAPSYQLPPKYSGNGERNTRPSSPRLLLPSFPHAPSSRPSPPPAVAWTCCRGRTR